MSIFSYQPPTTLQKLICIGIKSKPQKGEANKELIKKLSKHFNVSQSQVKITSEEKSRKKLIQIIT
ncbi:MAG TPA: DUF167 domain-containing protein [Nitrosopumilaceae archaeon]|nr:DUF167 domain-containing protein [Nitrosopumilaceae archaeon]